MRNKTFDCPKCGASHSRGCFGVEGNYRCLGCDYVGSGIHPDPEIDAEIAADIQEAEAFNVAHGIAA